MFDTNSVYVQYSVDGFSFALLFSLHVLAVRHRGEIPGEWLLTLFPLMKQYRQAITRVKMHYKYSNNVLRSWL